MKTQKTAIVTGASRGIGKAIALKLGQEGYAVVVNYVSSEQDALSVVQEIKGNNGQAIAIKANVASFPDMERLFAETAATFGGIDIVVNNAGVSKVKTMIESDDELFDYLFNVNVRGTLHSFKCAAKYVRNGGRIINFSSTAVATATPNLGVYIGAKAAVEAFTKVFAKELRGKNITVNTIAPGLIKSEMFFEGKTAEQIQHMSTLSPLERLGEVSEIANVVSFLASQEASWVNGQTIRVNGGIA
ncbi:3-oxoacyl-[acyl-carrier protein] reductase [Chitinophaga niastensis]|uniref:3-oxoacyl-[acyl-carrier protein] reductase n=1 Tax=Chitinophaga niastensis TaxID=536980 RepID=A0A2P8HLS7_CHINA|nr:SDR family oxidoreductase [Chitinophaga niastensis]PSL47174.1 3-oxoacyl-[acyl-carrier protein] reductase [Chitinophaga niastensis]